MDLTLRDLKPYVPAKDFALSRRFYAALGFHETPGWGGTADFELGGHAFRLQDYHVKDWANNFMFVLGVDDVDAWHHRAQEMLASGDFPGMRVKPPEPVDDSTVLHIWDPTGVLLVLVQ